MFAKTVLLVLVACIFWACDGPSKYEMAVVIDHPLTSDSYDADGNIFIYDSRIKTTYNYSLEIKIFHSDNDLGGSTIALSDMPDLLDYMRGHSSIDIIIAVSGGVMHIIDPDRTLLKHAHLILLSGPETSDKDNDLSAYLIVQFWDH